MLPADANLLVIHVARIGDTLLITPALRALKQACPHGRLTCLLHPARRALLENLPFIDALGAITPKTAALRGRFTGKHYDYALVYGHDAPLVRYALRVADKVIAFRQCDDTLNARLWRVVVPPAQPIHAVQERLMLAAELGVTTTDFRLACVPLESELAAVRAWVRQHVNGKPLIGLQVESFQTKAYRDWPAESFAELGRRLLARHPGAHLVLLGGRESRAKAASLARQLGDRAVAVAGQFGLRETVALMRQLDLYIGVDTGPTHIAGALGLPMVALYHCRHRGVHLAPLQHPRLEVVEHPAPDPQCTPSTPMAAISVDAVWEKAQRLLPPAPEAIALSETAAQAPKVMSLIPAAMRPLPMGLRQGPRATTPGKEEVEQRMEQLPRDSAVADLPKARSPMGPRRGPQAMDGLLADSPRALGAAADAMSEKLFIVHTESSCGWGGQELRTLTEAAGMLQRGHRVLLLCPAEAPIHAHAVRLGVPVEALPIARKHVRGFATLRAWLKHHPHIDALNTHSSTDAWLAALACATLRRAPPIVRTRHVSTPVNNRATTRWLYQRATHHIVTAGEALKQQLIRDNGFDAARITSVPTGIDLARYAPRDPAGARRALGLDESRKYLGIVATLRNWKGHTYLLEAFAQLAPAFPDWDLLLVGNGPQRHNLEKLVARLKLENRVRLVGNRDDVELWLNSFDVFVLPSYGEEGVSQSVMQAMATGLPVVATTVGAMAEAVKHQQTGLLVPPRNTEALHDALARLMRDDTLRHHFGAAGLDYARRHFGIEPMLARMEAVFLKVRRGHAGCAA